MATLRRIEFNNFKCFNNYSVALTKRNILVGPNNSGKSSILDALRLLSGSFRFARTRRPSNIMNHEGHIAFGYDIPEGSLPISLDNIAHEYSDDSAILKFTLTNNKSLTLQLHPNRRTTLLIDDPSGIKTRPDFTRNYPLDIVLVPILGPFEPEEAHLNERYVRQHEGTRLAHRHFRNIWLYREDAEFEAFGDLLTRTWPEIEIERPIHLPWPDDKITMFFKEYRITRELNWSGIGLQIWMQILMHILRGTDNSVFVIDEPDIYLHPDLQKKLMVLIRNLFPQFITATHSVEIINHANNEEIMIVDKSQRSAKRVHDIPMFQKALNYIGSNENVELARLSRAKRIIFFEGNDRKILKRIARHCGFNNFANDEDTLFLKLGGFSFWPRVENTAWTFAEIIGGDVHIFSLFDKDYRSREQIDAFLDRIRGSGVQCYVLTRKEIENFLLDIPAIHACLSNVIRRNDPDVDIPNYEDIEHIVLEESERFRARVFTQSQTERRLFLREQGDRRHGATIDEKTFDIISEKWESIQDRLKLVPGKELLSVLNTRFIDEYRRSVTQNGICEFLNQERLDQEFVELLRELDRFCAE